MGEVVEYPIVRRNDLTVDDFYRDLQQQGPIRVQLPFGEPRGWRPVPRREDGLRRQRFGKEMGLGQTSRMHERTIDDPDIW